eukprot:6768584-Prorocentrum_lima.AAC.1
MLFVLDDSDFGPDSAFYAASSAAAPSSIPPSSPTSAATDSQATSPDYVDLAEYSNVLRDGLQLKCP